MIARTVVENVASALTNNYKIEVLFRGSECYTDSKRIVLPSLPDHLPGELVEMIRGFLDHEVGHIIFTDFDIVKKAAKMGSKERTPIKFILNAVEDVRIEREMIKVYRGCGVNFDKSRELSTKKLKERWEDLKSKSSDPDGGADPILRTMVFFIYICQVGWEDPFIVEYASDIMPLLEHLSPEIEATEKLTSTADALKLSKKILEKIETFSIPEEPAAKMAAPKSETPPPAGKSKPTGGGSGPHEAGDRKILSGEYDGKDESEEYDDGPEPSKESDKPGEKSTSSKESETESETKSETEKSPDEVFEAPTEKDDLIDGAADEKTSEEEAEAEEPEDFTATAAPEKPEDESDDLDDESDGSEPVEPPETEEELEDRLEKESLEKLKAKLRESLESEVEREVPSIASEISDTAKTVTGYRPYSTEKDTFEPHPARDISAYQSIANELSGVVTTLRGRMSRVLLSQKRSRWEGNKRKGILNPAQLHQVVAKTSESVYRVRKEGLKMNTALSILIDLSGSMSGKIQITKQTTVLLAETLNKISVPFEILGFSGDHDGSRIDYKDQKVFNRWGSLNMYYFKKFDEPFGKDQKERIVGMHAHRENYDGESVMYAARRLLARPERKKIMFVLSDGLPAASRCQYETLNDHLKEVVKELEKEPSLYLLAFGMKTSAPKHFYRNYILVNNLGTLPETLMNNLYKQIM